MIAYLGPVGTFTEKAAKFWAKGKPIQDFKTIKDVFMAVEHEKVEAGVVPIENNTEGIVNVTIDTLIFDTNVFIQNEIVLPIRQALMVNKNNKDKNIKKIISHPQALAQCREYIEKNYPKVDVLESTSTSEASRIVSQSDEYFASIGTELCSDIYNLHIVDNNIQDNGNNKTYFIAVSKRDTSKPIVNKKISLAFSTLDKPGDLYKILNIFSLWDINLTKINSRPMKNQEQEYVFLVDIDGFLLESDVEEAFRMIKKKTKFFKVLGSYEILHPFN